MSDVVKEKRKVGDLRPSQLLHTFGVGSIVELPNLSVMVMGLDDWPVEQGASEINEPRLLRAVQRELGSQVVKLLTPPVTHDSTGPQSNPFDDTANIGVPVAPFPRWLLCPYCRLLAPIQSGLFELKLDPYRRDHSRYVHRNCKKPGKPPTAVPARFLVACANGHLDDFPWVEYVHKGKTDCRYELRLYELGASGEVADIQAQCVKCDRKRRMSDAFGTEGKAQLPHCRGRWPHLRKFNEEECKEDQRGILLGASNSWFGIMLSALSIPTTTDKLGQLVEQNWSELEECESAREVKLKRKLLRGLAAYTDDQVWEAVEKNKNSASQDEEEATDLREPEWKVFSNPDPKLNSRDFKLKVVRPPESYAQVLRKVVLAERLREVQSLIGFTRIESPGDYSEITELPGERRSPLSRSAPRWAPTSDVRGEGVFLHFSEDAIQSWLKNVKSLDGDFFNAHKRFRKSRGLTPESNYPAMRYVLLHSLAHALIRQFSLECGYTTASIRERIYSRQAGGDKEPMAGILLYTAAPDSEGTLGGLVSLGDPKTLARHLDQALEEMRLCASDPLCAEHRPIGDTLHGSACHACLFLPETSCERGNKYLDRSVLVSTVERADYAFFQGFAEAPPETIVVARTDELLSPPRPKLVSPEVAEVLEYCDERCQDFVQQWVESGLPLPIVGYELMDERNRVCAAAELAWPDNKVAALLTEEFDRKAAFESRGWTVFDATELKKKQDEIRTLILLP
ncbi:MAG TPA: DUF1998 domain-containing protein [Blastocatellia bacterium]|nr:DUF1998 domain-containing protein [Blastocatellia bacterium]